MTWAMDNAPDSLTPTQRHVLLVLADYVNDETMSAFPSLNSLANRTGLTERAVRNSLRVIESHGIISTTIKGARGIGERPIPADRRPNLYRWTASSLQRGESRSARKAHEGNLTTARGESSSSREGNDVPPNHNKNHNSNSTYVQETGTVLEFDKKAVLEAIRSKFPNAASWLADKAQPALAAGWLPYEIATEISRESVENARSVSALLSARLTELATRTPSRKTPRPVWCGECDEATRFVDLEDSRVARCKKCHPASIGVAV